MNKNILAVGLDRVGLWIESQKDRKQELVGTREEVPLLGEVSGIPVLQAGEDVKCYKGSQLAGSRLYYCCC